MLGPNNDEEDYSERDEEYDSDFEFPEDEYTNDCE